MDGADSDASATGEPRRETAAPAAGAPVAAPLAPAAQAAKVSPVNAGARPKPRAAEAFPSWGGLAEPVASADNLKEIVGIGQVIEARLRGLGVTSFRQLATMGDTDVERLVALLEGFGTRIISDDWVGQARELEVRYHGGL